MRLLSLFLIACLNIRDSNDSTLVLDHYPSSFVEEDHDTKSRSQFSKEQHKDPERTRVDKGCFWPHVQN